MELRKSGFTLAEFMISITAMLIVMAASLPVAFKKVTSEREYVDVLNGRVRCTPTASANVACQCNNSGECFFSLADTDKAEFVRIRLVGGGGGGASGSCASSEFGCKGGSAGEIKKMVLPSMRGSYRAVLGAGGNAGADGGTTSLFSCSSISRNPSGNNICENPVFIASASGGSSSNENAINAIAAEGEVIESDNGKGGNGGARGNRGEVILSW